MSEQQLTLLPEVQLVGNYRGYGMFFGRYGKTTRRFTIDFTGVVEDEIVTLSEKIAFFNGESTKRKYTITKLTAHKYLLEGDDIVGRASITASGGSLHWRYRLGIKTKLGRVVLRFTDWMYLQPDGVILNRAYASKWGIRVGEVFMSFTPETTTDRADASGPLEF